MSDIRLTPDPMGDPLLNSRSLCKFLDCTDRTLRTWRALGRLPDADVCIGRNLRWRRSTIERWLEQETRQRGRCDR
ncbi:MAG: helix-turn-helix domain-containing protein [Phycisphaerae bacterium]|nr:helix-turn-helix domain-containing protein [Phycisphaerae bacterium]